MPIKELSPFSDVHLRPEYLVFYWRGQCLDRFSHAELAISDCIEAIRDSGGELDRESYHPGALARGRSLALALSAQDFGGHQRVALQRLEEWIDLCSHRAVLAHGLFTPRADGVTMRLTEYLTGKRSDHPVKSYSYAEMREFLGRLEECVHKLVLQLGQIQAFCRKTRA